MYCMHQFINIQPYFIKVEISDQTELSPTTAPEISITALEISEKTELSPTTALKPVKLASNVQDLRYIIPKKLFPRREQRTHRMKLRDLQV